MWFFFFQAEDGIRDIGVTGVQTCALPIWRQQEERKRREESLLEGHWLTCCPTFRSSPVPLPPDETRRRRSRRWRACRERPGAPRRARGGARRGGRIPLGRRPHPRAPGGR